MFEVILLQLLINWKTLKWSWPNLRYHPANCLNVLSKQWQPKAGYRYQNLQPNQPPPE